MNTVQLRKWRVSPKFIFILVRVFIFERIISSSLKILRKLFNSCCYCGLSDETKSQEPTPNAHNSSKESVCVKKEIGLFSAVSMTLGIMIGSGIFVSPQGVLKNAGSIGLSLGVWIFTGVFSMIGGMCFAELGTSIPVSGCHFTYIHTSFGEIPAFMYLWAQMVVLTPVSLAIASLTFANYILTPLFPSCIVPVNAVRFLAALPMCK
ncbi:Y+L amino acid transporter 2 [Araneus ventricosus]|uniref:Y+L amino acid transporter 2 n=1 Tax=Araneus ventricosus TaxID=182803 RepID=A0A4Y2P3M8_ARAVE|nr:Y+L amino acid transporter 2 [Araneus ventricosus]